MNKIVKVVGGAGIVLLVVMALDFVFFPPLPPKGIPALRIINTINLYSIYVVDFYKKNNSLPNTLFEADEVSDRQSYDDIEKKYNIQYKKIDQNGVLFELCSDFPSNQSSLIPENSSSSSWVLSENTLCVKHSK